MTRTDGSRFRLIKKVSPAGAAPAYLPARRLQRFLTSLRRAGNLDRHPAWNEGSMSLVRDICVRRDGT